MKHIAILILILFLFGCKDNNSGIKGGIILAKSYYPSTSYPCSIPMFMGKTVMFMPSTCYTESHYSLLIDGYSATGKKVKDWVDVDAEFYRIVNVGDNVRIP